MYNHNLNNQFSVPGFNPSQPYPLALSYYHPTSRFSLGEFFKLIEVDMDREDYLFFNTNNDTFPEKLKFERISFQNLFLKISKSNPGLLTILQVNNAKITVESGNVLISLTTNTNYRELAANKLDKQKGENSDNIDKDNQDITEFLKSYFCKCDDLSSSIMCKNIYELYCAYRFIRFSDHSIINAHEFLNCLKEWAKETFGVEIHGFEKLSGLYIISEKDEEMKRLSYDYASYLDPIDGQANYHV